MSRETLGDKHPDTLTLINNMAQLQRRKGNLAQAELFAREALNGQRQTLGNKHSHTLLSMNNMAGLLLERGRPADAEPF